MATDLPERIKLNCPDCGRGLGTAPLMFVATEVVDRKCTDCGADWRAILRPLGRTPGGGVITEIEWNRITITMTLHTTERNTPQ